MKKDDRRVETIAFLGAQCEAVKNIFAALRVKSFRVDVKTIEDFDSFLTGFCEIEPAALCFAMELNSITALLKAADIGAVRQLPKIAFVEHASEAYRRLASEIGVDKLIPITDSPGKDAALLAEALEHKLQYDGLDDFPLTRGHLVTPLRWHDPDREIGDYWEEVSDLLSKLGVRRSLAGHRYLVAAIALETAGSGAIRPKYLYTVVADYYGVTPLAVEKAIRYAIESAWITGDIYTQHSMFGLSVDEFRGKPTNAEFIARLALEFSFR